MRSPARAVVVGLILALATGCASTLHKAESAAFKGDWDTAVAYFREALKEDPNRIDVKVALERALRNASNEHLKRAKDLEKEEQLSGAMAEYKLAASLDPGNTLASTKAEELGRRIRDQLDAARPKPRIEELRQQAQAGLPRLDPRTPIPYLRSTGSIRDLLGQISNITGIGVTYEQQTQGIVDRPFPFEIRNLSVEEALGQIMTSNRLTYKIIGQNTIFVYADTPQNRQTYEDQYVQSFMLSHADAGETSALLNQMLSQGSVGTRPQIQVAKNANMLVIKASLPVLQVIDNILKTLDKPRAEVMIEAEILEVDRKFLKQVGLDLNQWALGFAYSPEVAPQTTPGVLPPITPPPINLNTIKQGIGANDFYVTVPTALVQFLEQDSRTKVLARPQVRGRDGTSVQLRLGDLVPIPRTTFQSAAGGGIANIPTTQVDYQSVGVNLLFTPRVTYQDEIILENLTLEKSGLGANLEVGGQTFPTIVTRNAMTTLRLRDGESNLLAGLLAESDTHAATGFPGITSLPLLRSIFGNTQRNLEQTDVVMVITPRIIRTHELTVNDFKPMFVGVGQNFGTGSVPPLISPDAPPPPALAPPGVQQAPPPGQPVPVAGGQTPPGGQPPPRAPGVVPIQPVTPGVETPPSQGRVVVAAPSAAFQVGAPYTVPITIENVSQAIGIVSLTVTYDPAVLRAVNVSQGAHMQQGGVTTSFVPKIDAAAGRVEIAIARPFERPGASGSGVIAGISFEAVKAGTSAIGITGVLTTTTGQKVDVQMVAASVTVK
ncbi:MAG: cohesin domain-containing protein [Acidobacteriota bacterium]